ncbi:DUF6483 family protein [Hominifimenecus sp. rT4P-3]|uniref:DUF6483 family protein n=1 Tax=Hominifimenecus sp. rT4P-3 TaxID=3242979 RepID=UPI003DA66720
MVSEDYATRAIRDMVRVLAKMVLNEEVVSEPSEDSPEDQLYRKLLALADAGEINEAENLLSEELDTENLEHFRLAMAFYLHLNEMEEDFLDEHDYSKEEIADGVRSVGENFGYRYDFELLV